MARHSESGCVAETFAAIGEVRAISESLGQPMASVSLAWLLKKKAVCSVLAGARNPQQMAENAAAAELDLPDDIVGRLDAATEAVKRCLGANPDLWQTESRYR
ncbi:MAG: L-glyceraldehyde 3-phosphate reductase [candidate division BRC1 bacterium ADurb.BinA364]|nr:MAG: L-glyceraldehyde 3-phosphate reductase [candidate division BRC1 bacterium ADurb.BinA364]